MGEVQRGPEGTISKIKLIGRHCAALGRLTRLSGVMEPDTIRRLEAEHERLLGFLKSPLVPNQIPTSMWEELANRVTGGPSKPGLDSRYVYPGTSAHSRN